MATLRPPTTVRSRLHQRVGLGCLVAIAATFPFSIALNSVAIIALTANWLLAGGLAEKFRAAGQQPVVRWLTGFFALCLLSQLYSTDRAEGWRVLETKLAFLFLPPVLATTAGLTPGHYRAVRFTFVAACAVASFTCLSYAGYRYLGQHDTGAIAYQNFSEILHFHAGYFALANAFGTWLVAAHLLDGSVRGKARWLLVGTGATLLLTIGVLSSKTILAGFGILSAVALAGYFAHRRRGRQGLLAGLAVLGLGAGLTWSVPQNRARFADLTRPRLAFVLQDQYAYNAPFDGLSVRLVLWRMAGQLFYEPPHWLWGVGVGDVRGYLNHQYRRHTLDAGGFSGYNAHNQYVDTFVGLGLLGVAALLGVLASALRLARRQQDYPLLGMLWLFAAFSMTESTLNAQKGVVFFAFFVSLALTQRPVVTPPRPPELPG